jgi:hypothetical protein
MILHTDTQVIGCVPGLHPLKPTVVQMEVPQAPKADVDMRYAFVG